MTDKQRYWLKVGLVVLALGYLVISVVTISFQSSETMCSGLKTIVKDSATLRFVSKSDVSQILDNGGMNPLGVRYDCIDEAQIESLLESQTRIKRAECYKTPSGTLVVEVRQREPILRVMGSSGNYYIDLEGNVLTVSPDFTAFVPIVTGSVSKKLAKEDLYEFGLYLHENPFWKAQIEQIHFESNGKVILIPRVGNQIIEMGSLDDYERKLHKLYSLYKNGFNKVGWNRYKKINLSFDNQAVCTKK